MKRFGNLFDRITVFDNLLTAAHKAMRGKKHKPTVARFYFSLENELIALEEELMSGTYRPLPYTTFEIYEPKKRCICAADIRDRVVHHAICNIIEPILDRTLIHDTYACRKGKGTHAAVMRARTFSRRFPYFLKCDIRKYFETMDHEVLKNLLCRKFKDKRLLDLLFLIIDYPIPEGMPSKGVPIGNLTSQLFANFYIGELDHFLKDRMRIKGYLRYMDDFLVFSSDKRELWKYLSDIRGFLWEKLILEIKDEASYIAPISQGIPFLGFRIFPGTVRLKRENLVRFNRKVRGREKAFAKGYISHEQLTESVRGMVAHVSHANTHRMLGKIFFPGY